MANNFVPVPISSLVVIGMVFTVITAYLLVNRHYTTVRSSEIHSSLKFGIQYLYPFGTVSEILKGKDKTCRISIVHGYFMCFPVLRANEPYVIYKDNSIFIKRRRSKPSKLEASHCYLVIDQDANGYLCPFNRYTVSEDGVSMAVDEEFELHSRSVYCYKKDVGEVLALLYKRRDYGTPIEC